MKQLSLCIFLLDIQGFHVTLFSNNHWIEFYSTKPFTELSLNSLNLMKLQRHHTEIKLLVVSIELFYQILLKKLVGIYEDDFFLFGP